MLGGSVDEVKAAIDSNGQGSLAQDADFKAAELVVPDANGRRRLLEERALRPALP